MPLPKRLIGAASLSLGAHLLLFSRSYTPPAYTVMEAPASIAVTLVPAAPSQEVKKETQKENKPEPIQEATPVETKPNTTDVIHTQFEKAELTIPKPTPLEQTETPIEEKEQEPIPEPPAEKIPKEEVLEEKELKEAPLSDSQQASPEDQVKSEGAFHPPRALAQNRPPAYPLLARRKGYEYEGTVVLEVLVSEKGLVEELHVFESSGHPLLDAAAIKAVKRWRFSPATLMGQKVSRKTKVPIRFQLNKEKSR